MSKRHQPTALFVTARGLRLIGQQSARGQTTLPGLFGDSRPIIRRNRRTSGRLAGTQSMFQLEARIANGLAFKDNRGEHINSAFDTWVKQNEYIGKQGWTNERVKVR